MVWSGGKNRRLSRTLEKIIFGPINSFLSLLVEKTQISKRIFDFFGRVLPIPKTIVRGVPIKIILPLNQVGVYNTFKDWEKREPEVLDWIDGFEKGCIFFDVGASFGTETLYAALKKEGPKKIVSFDLALESSFNLAYNISLNNITNVEQYFLALSDGLNLNSYMCVTQYYYIEGRNQYDNVTYKTLSISMDQFIDMTHIFPDYIKIDVDGAEESIISGMTETVQDKKLRSVVIEVTDKSEPAISNFFLKAGFRIEFECSLTTDGTGYKNIIFTRK
ncbi:MAG: FkbM family methyltransferase [Deltaproteobacteria bacterium]|nr:FkbM family methyltransferase [Deltaproteobacteria bacterium]